MRRCADGGPKGARRYCGCGVLTGSGGCEGVGKVWALCAECDGWKVCARYRCGVPKVLGLDVEQSGAASAAELEVMGGSTGAPFGSMNEG